MRLLYSLLCVATVLASYILVPTSVSAEIKTYAFSGQYSASVLEGTGTPADLIPGYIAGDSLSGIVSFDSDASSVSVSPDSEWAFAGQPLSLSLLIGNAHVVDWALNSDGHIGFGRAGLFTTGSIHFDMPGNLIAQFGPTLFSNSGAEFFLSGADQELLPTNLQSFDLSLYSGSISFTMSRPASSVPGQEDQFTVGLTGGIGNFTLVPEPGTLALSGIGFAAMLAGLWRKRRAAAFVLPIAAVAIGLGGSQSVQAVTIPTVVVGNVGNVHDPLTGNLYGGVDYAYRIGTTEVTVGQYTDFLNAVAATDTYALYNTSMATNLNIAGISQTGSSGSYSYSVIGSPNKPITLVSWGDAARFSNWLHNGQPTGAQDGSTTEDGAYTLNGATSNVALNAVTRNASAQWFIPSEDEWYKAAYHQNDGVTDNYWEYPTSTDSVPFSDQPPGSDAPTPSNTANFYRDDQIVNGYDDGYAATDLPNLDSSQNYLTDVGAFSSAASPYGTFDQGGNAFEWNETLVFEIYRGVRGGGWDFMAGTLAAWNRGEVEPTSEGAWGFRVATVPEPGTFWLAGLGLASMFAFAWRGRRV